MSEHRDDPAKATREHHRFHHANEDAIYADIRARAEAAERERDELRAAVEGMHWCDNAVCEAAEARVKELEEAGQCVLTGTVPAKSPPDTNPDGSDSWSAVEAWRIDRLRERLLVSQGWQGPWPHLFGERRKKPGARA